MRSDRVYGNHKRGLTNILLIDPYRTRMSLLIFTDTVTITLEISFRLDDQLAITPELSDLWVEIRGHEYSEDKIPQTDLLPERVCLA